MSYQYRYRHRHRLPSRYRRYMFRAYLIFHSGTRLHFNIRLTFNSKQIKINMSVRLRQFLVPAPVQMFLPVSAVYLCRRTERTEVSGTGNTDRMPRYVPYQTHGRIFVYPHNHSPLVGHNVRENLSSCDYAEVRTPFPTSEGFEVTN